MMETPGWGLLVKDLETLVEYGKEHADQLYKTNDDWQRWRGTKAGYDFVLAFPVMVEAQLAGIEDEVFDDEDQGPELNSLEY